ncbi:MAG: hypothetical protein HY268_17780 [Deltaproteobacteria bacterium]|nr:hypothetical protein [Deltaproteobacteria bacterium]
MGHDERRQAIAGGLASFFAVGGRGAAVDVGNLNMPARAVNVKENPPVSYTTAESSLFVFERDNVARERVGFHLSKCSYEALAFGAW